jgi:hypothetical protein
VGAVVVTRTQGLLGGWGVLEEVALGMMVAALGLLVKATMAAMQRETLK